MDILLIKDGVVDFVSSVNSIEELQPYYPDHILVERTGEEWEGWKYINGAFIPPDSSTESGYYCITKLAFLNRFTDAEAIAIDLASQGNTIEAATMRRMQKKIDAANFIDLQDPTTQYGVKALESLGLLQAGRADEILSLSIQSKEYYTV